MRNPSQFALVDIILSHRFSETAKVIGQHPYTLLGQAIKMQGWGSVDFDKNFGYYFVDSFYLNYSLQFGMLWMGILCMIIPLIFSKLKNRGYEWLLLFMFLSSLHGVIISTIFLPDFNPIFIIAFAEYTNIMRNTGKIEMLPLLAD